MTGHGYETCARCGCLRRRSALFGTTLIDGQRAWVEYVCSDGEWCDHVRAHHETQAREEAHAPPPAAKGEMHGNAKLTEEQVRDIKTRLARGEKVPALAVMFGVDRGSIRGIRIGRTWKHVKPAEVAP